MQVTKGSLFVDDHISHRSSFLATPGSSLDVLAADPKTIAIKTELRRESAIS
jgi:hypothetical protein